MICQDFRLYLNTQMSSSKISHTYIITYIYIFLKFIFLFSFFFLSVSNKSGWWVSVVVGSEESQSVLAVVDCGDCLPACPHSLHSQCKYTRGKRPSSSWRRNRSRDIWERKKDQETAGEDIRKNLVLIVKMRTKRKSPPVRVTLRERQRSHQKVAREGRWGGASTRSPQLSPQRGDWPVSRCPSHF